MQAARVWNMKPPSTPYWDRLVILAKKVRVWVATLPKREPSVIIGVVASAAVAAQQALAGANVTTWREAVPVLLSLVIRQFVASPATVARYVAIAERAVKITELTHQAAVAQAEKALIERIATLGVLPKPAAEGGTTPEPQNLDEASARARNVIVTPPTTP